ncbi:hypothetical protein Gpo141_00009892, partial [Globisporangium polare]
TSLSLHFPENARVSVVDHTCSGRTKLEALPAFRVAARAHWETCSKLTKAEGDNVRRDSECRLKTDGDAVSILLLSNARGRGVTLSPDTNLAGKRVVGGASA